MVKLTAELIEQAAQYTNAVRDRELDLRGAKDLPGRAVPGFGGGDCGPRRERACVGAGCGGKGPARGGARGLHREWAVPGWGGRFAGVVDLSAQMRPQGGVPPRALFP